MIEIINHAVFAQPAVETGDVHWFYPEDPHFFEPIPHTGARNCENGVCVTRVVFASKDRKESSTASSGHKTILSLVIVNRVFLSRARGNDTDLMCNGMKFFRINWKFVRFAENYESANKAKEAAAVAAASR